MEALNETISSGRTIWILPIAGILFIHLKDREYCEFNAPTRRFEGFLMAEIRLHEPATVVYYNAVLVFDTMFPFDSLRYISKGGF
jgi:hypothetical protein